MSENELHTDELPIEASIEGLLFAASDPVSVSQLAEVLGKSPQDVEAAIKRLEETYQQRGLSLLRHTGKIQLTTSPKIALQVEKFLGLEASAKLSRAALECLAIVAYRQPITRPGIDSIRGVNSDGALKSLLSKGLAQEVGRAEGPGRPILYGTTVDFLQHFGLPSLEALPPYENIVPAEQQAPANTVLKD
jgi:segregation and condensation protein B